MLVYRAKVGSSASNGLSVGIGKGEKLAPGVRSTMVKTSQSLLGYNAYFDSFLSNGINITWGIQNSADGIMESCLWVACSKLSYLSGSHAVDTENFVEIRLYLANRQTTDC